MVGNHPDGNCSDGNCPATEFLPGINFPKEK